MCTQFIGVWAAWTLFPLIFYIMSILFNSSGTILIGHFQSCYLPQTHKFLQPTHFTYNSLIPLARAHTREAHANIHTNMCSICTVKKQATHTIMVCVAYIVDSYMHMTHMTAHTHWHTHTHTMQHPEKTKQEGVSQVSAAPAEVMEGWRWRRREDYWSKLIPLSPPSLTLLSPSSLSEKKEKKKEVLLMLRGFALFFFLFTRLRSLQSLLLFSLSVFTYSSARLAAAAAAGRILSSSCCRVNLFLIIIPLRLTAEGSAADLPSSSAWACEQTKLWLMSPMKYSFLLILGYVAVERGGGRRGRCCVQKGCLDGWMDGWRR